nr:P450 monooxygenase [Claviceps quebecensis]
MFILLFTAVAAYVLWQIFSSVKWKDEYGIPTMRCWPSIFPKFLDRLSYNAHAVRLVNQGYRQHKNQPFRLLKMDMDLIVIPLKYANELRAVTSDKLDPLTASFDDNAGKVTKILVDSELHTHAIQRRLTPRLPNILPVMMDELNHAFGQQNVDSSWIPVNPYEMVLRLSTRAAARLFVSEPICRDEDFLDTSASYSRNIFDTIATSRSLGHVITTYLGRWIPSVQAAQQQFQHIQKMLCSEVDMRRGNPEDGTRDDFLQWCMELARTEEEAHAASVAHRTFGILSMAVVHTTAMASTHILFDLISDENLQEKLREEQNQILKQGWKHITQQAMLSMRKLDSLMRESQRINPVGEFTFRRIVRQPITLSDGFQLHPGQQIAIAARCINLDRDLLPEADVFKPLRWTEQDGTVPTTFSNSSASNLHFGLGRYACPGRFMAAYLIKAIVSRILIDYDFKLQGDCASGRPPNLIHGDKLLPNRTATILLRRRNRA